MVPEEGSRLRSLCNGDRRELATADQVGSMTLGRVGGRTDRAVGDRDQPLKSLRDQKQGSNKKKNVDTVLAPNSPTARSSTCQILASDDTDLSTLQGGAPVVPGLLS